MLESEKQVRDLKTELNTESTCKEKRVEKLEAKLKEKEAALES